MSEVVRVIIQAKDEASAAIRATAKEIQGLGSKVAAFGKLSLGVFAAGRLEGLLRNSMKMAVANDRSLQESMQRLTTSFENAQISIGRAILGNRGIVWSIEQIAVALTNLGNSMNHPMESLEKLMLRMAKVFPGVLMGQGFRDVLTGRIAEIDAAVAGMDRWSRMMHRGTTDQPKPKPMRIGRIAKDLDIQGPEAFGSFAWADNQTRAFIPSSDDLAKALERSLADLSLEIPAILKRMKIMEEISAAFGQQVAQSFATAFGDGVAGFLESGSIEDGFKSLAGSLLSGLGGAMVQFGEAALMQSTLMVALMNALGKLNPAAGIGISLAMIAAGKTLQAVAGKAFGNMGSRSVGYAVSGTRSTLGGGVEAFGERGTVVIEYPKSSGGFANVKDPFFQELINQALAQGQGRRLVFRPR
jgi:hypothetical protein